MPQNELASMVREFVKDAKNLLASAQEAADHLQLGDRQAVADVVAITHYGLDQLSVERRGILEYLETEGVRPGAE